MAETAYEKIAKELPLIKEVHLPMVPDSTNETAIQIETNIVPESKTGWVIYGIRWKFQDILTPHVPRPLGATGDSMCLLQLVRGEKPTTPVFVEGGNRDLILEDGIEVIKATEGISTLNWPRVRMRRALTQLPELYLLFGSTADFSLPSAATIELYCEIMYHVITAPPARAERQ